MLPPVVDVPLVDVPPVVDVPLVDVPLVDVPVVDVPVVDVPVVEVPLVDVLLVDVLLAGGGGGGGGLSLGSCTAEMPWSLGEGDETAPGGESFTVFTGAGSSSPAVSRPTKKVATNAIATRARAASDFAGVKGRPPPRVPALLAIR